MKSAVRGFSIPPRSIAFVTGMCLEEHVAILRPAALHLDPVDAVSGEHDHVIDAARLSALLFPLTIGCQPAKSAQAWRYTPSHHGARTCSAAHAASSSNVFMPPHFPRHPSPDADKSGRTILGAEGLGTWPRSAPPPAPAWRSAHLAGSGESSEAEFRGAG